MSELEKVPDMLGAFREKQKWLMIKWRSALMALGLSKWLCLSIPPPLLCSKEDHSYQFLPKNPTVIANRDTETFFNFEFLVYNFS